MKGKLVLLGVAGAAVWGLALLDFGAHDPAAAPQDAPEAAAEPLSPAQRPHAVGAEQAPAEEPAAADSEAPADPAREPAPASGSAMVRAAQGTVAVIGKAARTLFTSKRPEAATAEETAAPARPPARATGELGEGARSPEYAAAERKYVSEARDGDWATAAEQRVRSLLERQPWSDSVSSLSCQQSTCQIVIEGDAKDPFQQLLRVPGLSDATGIGASTPYSLRSGQLSVYFSPPGDERADGR